MREKRERLEKSVILEIKREREKGGVRNEDFAWTQGGWAVHY
jgi:hypothetical protein